MFPFVFRKWGKANWKQKDIKKPIIFQVAPGLSLKVKVLGQSLWDGWFVYMVSTHRKVSTILIIITLDK